MALLLLILYTRNLYGIEWQCEHPNGSTTEFEHAWISLGVDGQKVCSMIRACFTSTNVHHQPYHDRHNELVSFLLSFQLDLSDPLL